MVLPLAQFASSAITNPPLSQRTLRRLTTDDGLPQNYVQCLLQSRDGYLWIGTIAGLARYDGRTFLTFTRASNPELLSDNCLALAEDAQGSIWVGTRHGLYQLTDGTFRAFTTADGLLGNLVTGLGAASNGTLWIGTCGGLNVLTNESIRFPKLSPEYKGVRNAKHFFEDSLGRLWFFGDGLGFVDSRAGETNQDKVIPFRHLIRREDIPVSQGFVDPEGVVWYAASDVAAYSGAVWQLHPDRRENITSRLHPPPVGALGELVCDGAGSLWVGSPHRLSRYSMRTLQLIESFDLDVTAIYCDRRGNTWAGSRNGLFQLADRPLRTLSFIAEEGSVDTWNICAAPDGGVWIGTFGDLWRVTEKTARRYHFSTPDFRPPMANAMRGLCATSSGDIWAGSDSGHVYRLYDFVKGEHLRVKIYYVGPVSINAISTLPNSTPLISSFNEVQVLNNETLVPSGRVKGLPDGQYLGIFQARNGDLWYGSVGNGIVRSAAGTLTRFSVTNGMPSNNGAVVHEDESGALWIGSDRGLTRYKDGRFASISSSQGLHADLLLALLDDQLGNYWFNSHQGIFRVSKAELNDFADGKRDSVHSIHYGVADGAPNLEGNASGSPNSCRDHAGRLWFPTVGGPVVIDPKEATRYDAPPKVLIEQVQSGQSNLLTRPQAKNENSQPFQIAPGRGNALTFRYTAIEFSGPDKVRFKHRLEGRDSHWIDTDNQRFAVFAGLPPGDYVFRVIACNRRGIWNETGASFAFTLLPFFYQTWPFRIACALILLGSMAGAVLYRFKLQRRLLLLEKYAALARERERIARDLHDDIGSSLTRIAMLSDVARLQVNGHAAGRQIDRISTISRELVDNMGELVWAANPKYDNLQSFAGYVREYAAQLLAPLGPKLEFLLRAGADPTIPLGAELRRDLFLVIKEALNNSLKHARPQKIRIAIEARPGALEITLSDDGCGISNERQSSFGNGLNNISERIQRRGGVLNVSSQPGAGTTLHIQIPRARVS